jgi:hypothetical protein
MKKYGGVGVYFHIFLTSAGEGNIGFYSGYLLILIQLASVYTLWIWTVTPEFRRYTLFLSSGSK